ncbi:MAG: hypothetical protein ACO1NX_03925, partial [Chitinophagaceae bacterium]
DSTLPVGIGKAVKHFQFRSAMVSISALTESKRPAKAILGFTQHNRPVEVYYFPGSSTKKALVIGGVHGSELSAIEVVKKLVADLSSGVVPYYSVVVIPCLFPDNAAQAALHADEIGSTKNIGRYTHEQLPDPNRQMPPLGKAYNENKPFDFITREIEKENRMLLQLIQDFVPDRIVNVHAIRNTAKAGIFADPRTDCKGIALGYQTDSLLAISMAVYIHQQGGNVKGNAIDSSPTALYSSDPAIAPKGSVQKRALHGSNLPNKRGAGVSLGAWASTGVCDAEQQYQRKAIRVITVEFPGNKRPEDYTEAESREHHKQLELYTAAISQIFLGEHYIETDQNP